nr:MAG TPA: hypothetical protein [Caudoviricetes sp.]
MVVVLVFVVVPVAQLAMRASVNLHKPKTARL